MDSYNILVVEDDQDINRLLCRILTDGGYDVRPAFSGSEAVLWAEQYDYDLVLLDPPYGKGILQRVLPALVPRLSDDAMVVCESGRDEELPAQVGSFVLDRERRHGKTKIALYLRGKDLAE